MSIVEPLPDLQWGKGTWQDYISNWRTRDTNWMQERLILRYQTTALRNAAWATPSAGQVTYNDETKTLEMWRASASAWVRSLMFQYLVSTQDTTAGTNIHHSSSGGKGIMLGPTSLLIDAPTTSFLSGVHTVDATGITVKVGTKTAKLSTDTLNLVSDSPLKAPGLDLSGGTGTVISAAGKVVSVGTLNADQGTITNISMSGTFTGGVLNGTSGTIGAVGHSGGVISTAAGSASANAAGLQSGQGYFYGDATTAVMRQRTNAGSAAGAAAVTVSAINVFFDGTVVQLNGTSNRVMANRPLEYATTAGTKYGGPVVYGADPGVGNVPEGTIWIS